VIIQLRAIALVLLALVASTSCGGSLTSVPRAVATKSPIAVASLKGRIMYLRQGGKFGDATVFTARADGSGEQRITDFGAVCCPRWAQDGSFILWGNEFHRPDGTLIRKVSLPSQPGLNLVPAAYSPATDRLAVEGWDDSNPTLDGIYTVRASDGGDLVRVTQEHDVPADFSPDGSSIFFAGSSAPGSLFEVDADGSNHRQVTPAGLPVDAGGRISPDGRWLVFTSYGVMWIVHPDGSGLSKIFEDLAHRLAVTPTWSPDGDYILFAMDPPGTNPVMDESPPNELYVIRADGSGLALVLASNDFKKVSDWVP